jgi:hypothetical protein
MADHIDSSIVRKMIDIGSKDPLALLLTSYLASALDASLFSAFHVFLEPHEEKLCEMFAKATNASISPPELSSIRKTAHHLNLVYRLAVFDSFLNNLTNYALAVRPAKAIGRAEMQASILLGKSRAQIVNEYIAKRTKTLSRERFDTRIKALQDITEVEIVLPKNDLASLSKLSELRNAIVHEGAGFQFTVDDNLQIHSQAQMQQVSLTRSERFDVMNRLAALIYEQFVSKFVPRDLNEMERTAIKALHPSESS